MVAEVMPRQQARETTRHTSTRSTRSTRGMTTRPQTEASTNRPRRPRPTQGSGRAVNTEPVRTVTVAPVRPKQPARQVVSNRSTRPTGTRSTRQPSQLGQSNRPVTVQRVKASTRAPRSEPVDVPKPKRLAFFKEDAFVKKEPKKSTRPVYDKDGNLLDRSKVYGSEREQQKYVAPLNLMVTIFFAICVSMLAFGLLRGNDPTGNTTGSSREVIVQPVGPNTNTSTNTGILRNSGR